MTAREMFEEQRYKRNEEDEEITYSQRFGSGYFRITFDLLKKEIAIDTNMENVIESDLLQAIIQQVKELHWFDEKTEIKQESNLEHYKEEIKQETNLEHYKDEIKYAGYEFALVNGKPTTCRTSLCDQCYFNDMHFTCARKRMEWMLKPYKKSVYKLTQFEYDLLNAYKDCGMLKPVSYYSAMHELYEKGYFEDIDIRTPIHEILDNCEVIKDGNC